MPLLTVSTRADWQTATVTWTPATGSPVVWSPATGIDDARSALDDLVSTLGGGAWWQASRSSSEAGMSATVYTGTSYTVTSNPTAQALMGWPATQGPTTAATSGPWPGTLYCQRPSAGRMLRRWWRSVDGEGEPGLIPSSPGTSSRVPLLAQVMDAVEASRLTAILAMASSPRTANYTDDPASSSPTWRVLTLGSVTRSMLEPLRWLAKFAVRG